MTRLSKILSLIVLVAFVLACNFVTQPINEVQDFAGTAQALGTALPVETLRALPSLIPAETLQALPSALPTVEALATEFGNALDPQGTPVQEWQGIPILPQAIAGEESGDTYTFKVNVPPSEVQNFYDEELLALGWNKPSEPVVGAEGGALFFEKDNSFLMILMTSSQGSTVVILTLA